MRILFANIMKIVSFMIHFFFNIICNLNLEMNKFKKLSVQSELSPPPQFRTETNMKNMYLNFCQSSEMHTDQTWNQFRLSVLLSLSLSFVCDMQYFNKNSQWMLNRLSKLNSLNNSSFVSKGRVYINCSI